MSQHRDETIAKVPKFDEFQVGLSLFTANLPPAQTPAAAIRVTAPQAPPPPAAAAKPGKDNKNKGQSTAAGAAVPKFDEFQVGLSLFTANLPPAQEPAAAKRFTAPQAPPPPAAAAKPRPTATHVLVDSIKKSRKVLAVIEKSVAQSKAVAVDIEGDLRPAGRLSLIQIGLESEAVFLFDVLTCPALLGENAGLRNLLSDSVTVTKILHDCRNDAAALKGQFNIELAQVWDTQIAHAILEGKDPKTSQKGLNVILQTYAGKSNVNKKEVQHGPGVWEQRPLPSLLQVEHLKSRHHSSMHHVTSKTCLCTLMRLTVS
jgi:hypothetical protein